MELQPERIKAEAKIIPASTERHLRRETDGLVRSTRRSLLTKVLAVAAPAVAGENCAALGQETKKEKSYEHDSGYQQFIKDMHDTIAKSEYTLELIQNYAKETLPSRDPAKIFAFGKEFDRAGEDVDKEFKKLTKNYDRLMAEISALDPDLAEAIKGKFEEIITSKENLAERFRALFYEYIAACDEFIPKVNKDDFRQEVLDQKGLTLVFLSAEWCPPCQWATPIIAEFGVQIEDTESIKIKKAVLSTRDRKDINLGIVAYLLDKGAMPQAAPAFILFVNGEPISVTIGAFGSTEEIREFIKQGLTDKLRKKLQEKESPDTVPDEILNPDKSPREI